MESTYNLRSFMDIVEMLSQRLALQSKWATAKRIQAVYGIDRRWLAELVGRGLVKKVKKGHTQQALTLYRVEDVERHLEGVADGKVEP